MIYMIGDIDRKPQPFVGMKYTQFIGNTGTLFGQILIDTTVSNIDPTSSISWRAPESSRATQVYNNTSILELYNITLIRNTIYILGSNDTLTPTLISTQMPTNSSNASSSGTSSSSSSGYVSGDFDELFVFRYHRIRMKHSNVKDNECYGYGNSISSGNQDFE